MSATMSSTTSSWVDVVKRNLKKPSDEALIILPPSFELYQFIDNPLLYLPEDFQMPTEDEIVKKTGVTSDIALKIKTYLYKNNVEDKITINGYEIRTVYGMWGINYIARKIGYGCYRLIREDNVDNWD